MLVQYNNGRRAQVIGSINSGVVPNVVNYYRVSNANGRKGWWNAANVRVLSR
jgi:hypothetical protein